MAVVAEQNTVKQESTYCYPDYPREERIADGAVHAIGIFGSIAAFTVLFAYSSLNEAMLGWLAVYAACVIALFLFSAAYHMTPWPEYRPLLRRFDQSAIFFKIAGTYTPLVFLVGTNFAYSLLAAIWTAAIAGSAIKLLTGDRLDRHTIVIYLALGWSSVLLLWPLFHLLPLQGTILVVGGGILYTVGIWFHQAEHVKYSNAIWHAFVLAASACHFWAIADAAIAAV